MIIGRCTVYSSKSYNHQINGDPSVLTCQESANGDDHPILREEVEAGIRALKNGKAAGVDNIQTELIKRGGETVTDMLTKICNEVWRTGVANTLDAVTHHHTPQERKSAALSKPQNASASSVMRAKNCRMSF